MTDGQETKPLEIVPCWALKKCTISKCVAYGKVGCCYVTPNAGFAKRFCDGPMCVRLKNMVCPSCPVAKQWGLDEDMPKWTDEEIQSRIEDGFIIVKKPLDAEPNR